MNILGFTLEILINLKNQKTGYLIGTAFLASKTWKILN